MEKRNEEVGLSTPRIAKSAPEAARAFEDSKTFFRNFPGKSANPTAALRARRAASGTARGLIEARELRLGLFDNRIEE
jgi:hypothetical protein